MQRVGDGKEGIARDRRVGGREGTLQAKREGARQQCRLNSVNFNQSELYDYSIYSGAIGLFLEK